MSTTFEITAGWTAVIDITLLSQGEAPSGTMDGMAAELILRDQAGNLLPTTGDVSIPNVNNWLVRYSPDAADLVPGTYRGRVKVTDAGGLVAFFPSGEADVWIVRPETW